jgi:hypothetical protein
MSFYFIRVSHDNVSGVSDNGFDFADRDAAWADMTQVCGDLVGSISRNLKQNAEWHMELLDESKKPLFRIRLVAETLN